MATEQKREEEAVRAAIRQKVIFLGKAPYSGDNFQRESETGKAAITHLHSAGYITEPSFTGTPNRAYYLTPTGWVYYEELTIGKLRFWLKRNWFPAVVAAATFLTGLATLIFQIVVAMRQAGACP